MNVLVKTVTGAAAMLLVASHSLATSSGYSIGLNFGADEYYSGAPAVASNAGTLASTAVAGVDAVKQANWNNLEFYEGYAENLTADNRGAAVTSTAVVYWNCNNTWSTTGRGEENNGFPTDSSDYVLMIGYLDTGDPTTTAVTFTGLPAQLTSGYDVYVYLLGGTGGNRGGGYRITDELGNTLKDYLIGDSAVSPTEFVRDPGFSHDDKGNYIVFRGLTAANIVVEATTEAPYGMVRAPINAIQLVAAAKDTAAPTVPANLTAELVGASFVDLKWDAATDNSGSVYYYELERGGTVVATHITGTTYRDATVGPASVYTYRVRAFDDSANASAYSAPLELSTLGEIEVRGVVKDEIYTGLTTTGALVSELLGDPNYPDNPAVTLYRTGPEGPAAYADGYGSRLSGWFTPSRSGSYIFFLSADDNAELYLSTDATTANKKLIAMESSWSNSREWITSSGGSTNEWKRSDQYADTQWPGGATINLTAGTKYYFEALHKEGGGGDNLGFTYSLVDDPLPKNGDAPFLGPEFSTMMNPLGANVTISQQPVNVTVAEGTTATFTVVATGVSPYDATLAYQWYRNGVQIRGAADATYTTPEVSLTADNGAKFKCYVAVAGAYVFTDEVTLTVATDTTPPKITRVKATSVSTLVVTFDEPVDPVSAQAVGNYGISGGVALTGATASESSVLLNTSALTVGSTYTLTVAGVKDRFGNAVPAGTTYSFSADVITYADVILADGPVLYYRFEETTGTTTKNYGTAGTAADGLWMSGLGPDVSSPTDVSSGNGPRPGEFLGFAADNRSGRFTGADTVGGDNLWVDAQQQLLNNLGAFSLEYWVKPANRVSDPTAFGTRIGIVGQNDAIEYGFIDQNTIQIWTPGGGSLNTTYSFPDNTWHHVATIADGRSIKNYFDGKFINQTTATTANYGNSTYNVHVGGGGAFDATGNFFTGEIDEVAIFQKAIPADRIAAHYKAGKEGGEAPGVDPVISGITRAGSSVVISYDGILQSTTSLTGAAWTDVVGAPTGAGQTHTVPATGEAQFFRATRQ